MLVWSLATALGLGALIGAFPASLTLLKLLGGGHLLFLGLKAGRAAVRGGGASAIVPDARPLSDGEAWRRGLLVLLTNGGESAVVRPARRRTVAGPGTGQPAVTLRLPPKRRRAPRPYHRRPSSLRRSPSWTPPPP